MKRVMPTCLVVAAGTVFASSAVAVPPVLDFVPEDATLIAALPSGTSVHRDISELATAIQAPIPIPGIEDLLANAELPGVDADRAVVLYMTSFPDPNGPEPDGAILLPVDSYDDFVKAFGGTPTNGIDALPDRGWAGDEMAKKLPNGYVAISDVREVLESIGSDGNLDAHKALLGPAGRKLAEDGDGFIVVNIGDNREAVGQVIDGFMEQADMMMMMAGGGADMAGAAEMMTQLVDQSESLILSMDASNLGLSLDLAMNFTEGSEYDATFKAAGRASSLIGKLPNQPFFFAGAFDTDSAPMKEMFKQMNMLSSGLGEDNELADQANAQADAMNGGAMMVGFVPGIMSGIFQKTVLYFESEDPTSFAGTTKAFINKANGFEHNDPSMGAMSFSTKYTDDAEQVGGVSVDQYEMTIRMQNAGGMGMNPMMLMFGPYGGPRGYVATLDGGVIQTFSRDKALLGSAIDAANGGESLSNDAMLRQVASKLPENRLFEGYIGFKPMLDAALPLVAMAMPGVGQVDMPDKLPPIGMGIGAMDGDATATMFVPAPVIKTAMELQAMMQGGPGQGFPEDDEDAGQPMF